MVTPDRSPRKGRLRGRSRPPEPTPYPQTTPWSSMASATFTKPAMFAPTT
jgi:hypothetical protein